MIKDLFFIIKMIGLTVLVCLAMQVKIGEKTVEQEFYTWLQNSIFVDYIQTAIDGGVVLTRTGYKKVHIVVNTALHRASKHNKKNERGINMDLKRYNEKEKDDEDVSSLLPKVRVHSQQVK